MEISPSSAQRHITARRRIGAWEGASGCAALRRAAPPHGPSPLLGSGPRRLPAARYAPLRWMIWPNIIPDHMNQSVRMLRVAQ